MLTIKNYFNGKVSDGISLWLLGILFLGFMCSFFVGIPSKANNNYFYIFMALPAVIVALKNIKETTLLFKEFYLLWLSIAITTISYFFHGVIFKDAFYVGLLFCFIWLFFKNIEIQIRVFAIYTVIAIALCIYVYLTNNYVPNSPSIRLAFFGQTQNPVYAACMLLVALIYLWIFHLEKHFIYGRKEIFLLAILVYFSVCISIISMFEARSTIVGLAAFMLFYAYSRQLLPYLFFIAVFSLVFIEQYGLPDFVLQRGLSFRGEIWIDVLDKMTKYCSLINGCGNEDYLFLDKFSHPHNAYLSLFFRAGILALMLFLFFTFDFFKRSMQNGSRWFLVALPGWFALLTTTGGFYTSPKPLWVYFWIPTFFAMVEIYNKKQIKR